MRVDEAPSLDFILPQLKDPFAKLFINEGPYPTSEKRLLPSDVVLYVQTPLSSVIQDPIPLTHQDISDWQQMSESFYSRIHLSVVLNTLFLSSLAESERS